MPDICLDMFQVLDFSRTDRVSQTHSYFHFICWLCQLNKTIDTDMQLKLLFSGDFHFQKKISLCIFLSYDHYDSTSWNSGVDKSCCSVYVQLGHKLRWKLVHIAELFSNKSHIVSAFSHQNLQCICNVFNDSYL